MTFFDIESGRVVNMNSLYETLVTSVGAGLSLLVESFMVLSVVLFIVDGIKAKRQHRRRKVGITVMFIFAVIIAALSFIGVMFILMAIAMYIAGS